MNSSVATRALIALSCFMFSPGAGLALTTWNYSAELGYVRYASLKSDTLIVSDIITDSLINRKQKYHPAFALKAKNQLSDQVFLGPAFYYQQAQYQGDVWELGSPVFNNYSFSIKCQNYALMYEGDLVLNTIVNTIKPFLTAGIGVQVAHGRYDDYAKPGIPVYTEYHLDNLAVNMVYEFGFGVMKRLQDHYQLSLSYRYFGSDDNQVRSGQGRGILNSISMPSNNQAIFIGVHYNT